jgi:hypothetical protein
MQYSVARRRVRPFGAPQCQSELYVRARSLDVTAYEKRVRDAQGRLPNARTERRWISAYREHGGAGHEAALPQASSHAQPGMAAPARHYVHRAPDMRMRLTLVFRRPLPLRRPWHCSPRGRDEAWPPADRPPALCQQGGRWLTPHLVEGSSRNETCGLTVLVVRHPRSNNPKRSEDTQ